MLPCNILKGCAECKCSEKLPASKESVAQTLKKLFPTAVLRSKDVIYPLTSEIPHKSRTERTVSLNGS